MAQVQAMVGAFEQAARNRGGIVSVDVTHKYDAYRLPDDLPILRRVMAELRAMGHEPRPQISGGGSDVNIFVERGLQMVNVAVGYREIHSTAEHIALADIVRAAELIERLLAAPESQA